MQITIKGRHLELTDKHREYVQKRLAHLKRFFDSVMDVQVVLGKEKHRESAEITIKVNGVTMHGEEETEDIFASIDLVIDKMERQLRKYKDRLDKRYRNRGGGPENSIRYKEEVVSGEDLDRGQPQPRIIRSQSWELKPLMLEEAVMQMDLMNRDFLVFRNASTEKIAVLYRRRDGNYVLVEPES